MSDLIPVTVARGDGIGPEIMDATLRILEEGGAKLAIEEIEIGRAVYERGIPTGIEDSAWESLRRTKVFLKAPITTPQGGGFKSLNVTIRKALGLYANVRPCVSFHPFVQTKHPKMDTVIVRENEEDLYAGIEYRQTQDVFQSLKLISHTGSERICRYAFEYARSHHRHKVTALVKDNIMKLTDGEFHRVFKSVAEEFPEIEADSLIVDIGTARLADTPEIFDVIVTLNLYGDIISDVAAQIAGSVGLAGSANIGDKCAMFEAIHGSAPTIAGQQIANPSGLLQAAVMMLVHIGQGEAAARIHNAWLRTIEDGVHTADIFDRTLSKRRVKTGVFAEAVIARLGELPKQLAPVSYQDAEDGDHWKGIHVKPWKRAVKELVGVDVFFDWPDVRPVAVAERIGPLAPRGLALTFISNRGQKVWPGEDHDTWCSDHWRCRFMTPSGLATHGQIASLLADLSAAGLDYVKTENLYRFDGKNGFSADAGE
jgi:isocitrate dehydrogenase